MPRVRIARVKVPGRGTKAIIFLNGRWYLLTWSQYKLLLKAADPEKYERLDKSGYIPDPAIDPTPELVEIDPEDNYYISKIYQPTAWLEIRDENLFKQLVEKLRKNGRLAPPKLLVELI